MRTIFKKTASRIAAAAILGLFALFLVTCEDLANIFPQKEDEVEYLDWQYEQKSDGSGTLTMTLDGSKPFAYEKSQSRGLNSELAKMIHDYFEIIFIADATLPANAPATGNIARTSWEIGYPAGIGGLYRNGSTGVNYGDCYPTANGAASVVFAGKKQGKTLLGIGKLVQVTDAAGAPKTGGTALTVADGDTSVTYAVMPLTAKIIDTTDPDVFALPSTDPSFITSAGGTIGPASTTGSMLPVTGGLSYPLFTVPGNATTLGTARYTIGGPDNARWSAARIFPTSIPANGDTPAYVLGLEVIKRTPSYRVNGKTMEAYSNLDTYTVVSTDSNQTGWEAFDPVIDITIKPTVQTGGVFAITFQCPVFAITNTASSPGRGDKLTADKWYIRSSYNEYQFLLDSGSDAGGMVMLGSVEAGSVDWLEIYTTGIGFSN